MEGNLNNTNANNETLENLVTQFQGKPHHGDAATANSARSTNKSLVSGVTETGPSAQQLAEPSPSGLGQS